MIELATRYDKFFEKLPRYRSMIFSLQEAVKDIAHGTTGVEYLRAIDVESEVYKGGGCYKGVRYAHLERVRLLHRRCGMC